MATASGSSSMLGTQSTLPSSSSSHTSSTLLHEPLIQFTSEGAEDVVWVSLHRPLPKVIEPESSTVERPVNVFYPQWLRDTTFFLCFTPRTFSDVNGLFEGLPYSEKEPQIVLTEITLSNGRQTKVFQLAPAIQRKWAKLNNLLDALINKMPILDRPVPIEDPFEPAKYKFTEHFALRTDARRAVINARAALYSKFAYLSFAACQRGLTSSGIDERRVDLPSDVIAFMQNSPICKPVPRVGGFIKAYNTEQATYVRYLKWLTRESDVPLWIKFGTEEQIKMYPSCVIPEAIRTLQPTLQAISQARTPIAAQDLSEPSGSGTWSTFKGPLSNSWSTDSGTWGTDGGSWGEESAELANKMYLLAQAKRNAKPVQPKEYFEAQAKRRAERIAKETPSERRLREEVEARNSEEPKPLHAHHVWHWKLEREFGIDEEVVWSRCIVSKRKVKALWWETAPTQRRFHYFNNQCWDVWEDLDPFAVSDEGRDNELLDSQPPGNSSGALPTLPDATYSAFLSGPSSSSRRSASPTQRPRGRERSPYRPREQPRGRELSPYRPREQPRGRELSPYRPREQPRGRELSPYRPREQRDRGRSPYRPREQRDRGRSPYRPRERPREYHDTRAPASARDYRSPSRGRRRSLSLDRAHSPPRDRRRPPHLDYARSPPRDRLRSPRRDRLRSPSRNETPLPSLDSGPLPQSAAPVNTQSLPSQRGTTDWSQLVREFLGEPAPDRPHRYVEPILTILQQRYGFTQPPGYTSTTSKSARKLGPGAVASILSCSIDADPIPSENADAVLDFIGCLVDGIPPPLELSDLVVESPAQYLSNRECPTIVQKLTVTKSGPQEDGEVDNRDPSPTEVYVLKPRHLPEILDFPWLVVVDNPITAAHVLRGQWGLNKIRLVEELIRRGIPFKTLLPLQSGHQVPSRRPSRQSTGIGGRPREFEPKVAEYVLYENLRDSFLREHPHAISALSAGGILWRLAIDCLEIQSAFRGPGSDPEHQVSLELNREMFVHDTLDSGEEDIICGVYKVLTNENSTALSDFSWWPKQSVWHTSGANAGYWTSMNEYWFQTRLAEIRAGTATPYTARDWKRHLKYHRTRLLQMLAKVGTLTAAQL